MSKFTVKMIDGTDVIENGRVTAQFELTGFGETHRAEAWGQDLGDAGYRWFLDASELAFGIMRGRAGTKVWIEPIVIYPNKVEEGHHVSAPGGDSHGHGVRNIVNWWHNIPEDRRSKKF